MKKKLRRINDLAECLSLDPGKPWICLSLNGFLQPVRERQAELRAVCLEYHFVPAVWEHQTTLFSFIPSYK